MPRKLLRPSVRPLSGPRRTYTGTGKAPDPLYHFDVENIHGEHQSHDGTHALMSDKGMLTIISTRSLDAPPVAIYAPDQWMSLVTAPVPETVTVKDPDPDEAPVPAP